MRPHSPITRLRHLKDVMGTGWADGDVPVYNESEDRFAPGEGGSGDVPPPLVEGGTTTSDGLLAFRYGIDDDGNPYFDDIGTPIAESATLHIDTATATFHLEVLL